MKTVLSTLLTLSIFTAPVWAITVTTPANGALVSSPFRLTASTTTCDSKAAVSMGYSIDNGPTTIISTSFNAMVPTPEGTHVLHVKCWGQQVSDQVLLDITVVPASVSVSVIAITTPANGAQVTSPFELTANTTTCGSKPAVSMGYSIDNGPATIVPTSFNAMVPASQGTHILHVKCWGQQVSDQVHL